jgi:methyl-accepting chemotaxis protein
MNALRQLRIGARLTLAFSVLLIILALTAGVGYWRLQTSAADAHQLGTVDSEKLRLASTWRQSIELNWNRTRASLQDSDTARIPEWSAQMDVTSKRVSEISERIGQLATSPQEKALIDEINQRREAYRTPRAELTKRRIAGEDVSGVLRTQLRPLAEQYDQALQRFEEAQGAIYQQALERTAADASMGQRLLVGFTVAALLLVALLAWVLTTSITAPLAVAGRAARRVAAGDLTQDIRIEGRDEATDLLTALKEMQHQLGGVVANVRANAEGVSTASGQIAAGNNDLSMRTEQQASALEQTAASMEELSSTVRQNAENARQANSLASNASMVAAKGGEVVARVVDTMKGIQDSSNRIADIISVIDSIAFQTNILALNAAVEAARAGEQGRGFAVVASEVRSLAGRSAEAAREIKALIGASVDRVQQGTTLVDEAGTTMDEVVSAIRRVTDIMGEISAASSEQSTGVAQVGQAITEMDQTTQKNAALVEESAAAADSLRHQAEQLVQAMAVFQLRDGAPVAPRAAPPKAAPTVAAAPRAATAPAKRAQPQVSAAPAPVAAPVRKGAPPAPTPSTRALPPAAPTKAARSAPAASSEGDWESF